MKHDTIVDGEAMADIEGVDVTHLVGGATVISMMLDPQRAAFQAYKVAFNANASDPNLKNAAALVAAWNALANAMGLDRL